MRLLINYVFQVGTKLSYSKWPELVHRFLQKQGLSSNRFMYFFKDYLGYGSGKFYNVDEYRKNLERGGCSRLLTDCPECGPLRIRPGENYGWPDYSYLSNIDGDPFPEAKLLPLMKKIHRSYGFLDSYLYYYDIDFFHDLIPFGRDYSDAERHCAQRGLSVDKELLLEVQPYGSGIVLHRNASAENYIQLSIDLLHNGEVLDPKPYYDAMRELLPRIRVSTSIKLYLSQPEQDAIEATNRIAAPVLKRCRNFFAQRLTHTDEQNLNPSNYSIAKTLKKLCKQYNYSYKRIFHNYVFSMEKRSPRGNFIFLEIQSGPSHYHLGFGLSFQGVGFKHELGGFNYTPTSQKTADACMNQVMETLAEFETTLLPALDALFPETPDWFLPSD